MHPTPPSTDKMRLVIANLAAKTEHHSELQPFHKLLLLAMIRDYLILSLQSGDELTALKDEGAELEAILASDAAGDKAGATCDPEHMLEVERLLAEEPVGRLPAARRIPPALESFTLNTTIVPGLSTAIPAKHFTSLSSAGSTPSRDIETLKCYYRARIKSLVYATAHFLSVILLSGDTSILNQIREHPDILSIYEAVNTETNAKALSAHIKALQQVLITIGDERLSAARATFRMPKLHHIESLYYQYLSGQETSGDEPLAISGVFQTPPHTISSTITVSRQHGDLRLADTSTDATDRLTQTEQTVGHALTEEQAHEILAVTDEASTKPEWFRKLSKGEQRYIAIIVDRAKADAELLNYIRRYLGRQTANYGRIPGTQNAYRSMSKLTIDGVTIDLICYRSSMITADISKFSAGECIRLAEQNFEQLVQYSLLEKIKQLQAEFGALHDGATIHLPIMYQSLLSPNVLEVTEQVNKFMPRASHNNAVMVSYLREAIKRWQQKNIAARNVIIDGKTVHVKVIPIVTNCSTNALRHTVILSARGARFIGDELQLLQSTVAFLKLYLTMYLEDESTRTLLAALTTLIQTGEITPEKLGLIKRSCMDIASRLPPTNSGTKKLHLLLVTLPAYCESLFVYKNKAIEKHVNIELMRAAYQNIICSIIGIPSGSCKSGHDRKGYERMTFRALLLYYAAKEEILPLSTFLQPDEPAQQACHLFKKFLNWVFNTEHDALVRSAGIIGSVAQKSYFEVWHKMCLPTDHELKREARLMSSLANTSKIKKRKGCKSKANFALKSFSIIVAIFTPFIGATLLDKEEQKTAFLWGALGLYAALFSAAFIAWRRLKKENVFDSSRSIRSDHDKATLLTAQDLQRYLIPPKLLESDQAKGFVTGLVSTGDTKLAEVFDATHHDKGIAAAKISRLLDLTAAADLDGGGGDGGGGGGGGGGDDAAAEAGSDIYRELGLRSDTERMLLLNPQKIAYAEARKSQAPSSSSYALATLRFTLDIKAYAARASDVSLSFFNLCQRLAVAAYGNTGTDNRLNSVNWAGLPPGPNTIHALSQLAAVLNVPTVYHEIVALGLRGERPNANMLTLLDRIFVPNNQLSAYTSNLLISKVASVKRALSRDLEVSQSTQAPQLLLASGLTSIDQLIDQGLLSGCIQSALRVVAVSREDMSLTASAENLDKVAKFIAHSEKPKGFRVHLRKNWRSYGLLMFFLAAIVGTIKEQIDPPSTHSNIDWPVFSMTLMALGFGLLIIANVLYRCVSYCNRQDSARIHRKRYRTSSTLGVALLASSDADGKEDDEDEEMGRHGFTPGTSASESSD